LNFSIDVDLFSVISDPAGRVRGIQRLQAPHFRGYE
jgi:hypothetical protein